MAKARKIRESNGTSPVAVMDENNVTPIHVSFDMAQE
jgi:hypothetical protein